jgi:hypothetical protein
MGPMTKLLPANTTPAMLELYKTLLASRKFLNWKSDQDKPGPMRPQNPAVAEEKHFTPQELSGLWGVSAETIRITFREEPGVLRLKQPTKGKRQYVLLRIPVSVAERVHRRLSAVPQ